VTSRLGKDEVAVEPLTPMSDELPFKVVRSNGTDEVLARAVNLLVARGAYQAAAKMYL
jgi:hypothetical protein